MCVGLWTALHEGPGKKFAPSMQVVSATSLRGLMPGALPRGVDTGLSLCRDLPDTLPDMATPPTPCPGDNAAAPACLLVRLSALAFLWRYSADPWRTHTHTLKAETQ